VRQTLAEDLGVAFVTFRLLASGVERSAIDVHHYRQ
jgi:hypothetical protein